MGGGIFYSSRGMVRAIYRVHVFDDERSGIETIDVLANLRVRFKHKFSALMLVESRAFDCIEGPSL